jgi:hypothetical protein
MAFLAQDGTMSQEARFPAGRHFLRFRAVQSSAGTARHDEDFRVKLDGRQIGIFEPPQNGPCWMLTAAFTVAAGPHTVTFEGLNTAGKAVADGDNICLIDSISIH